MRTVLLPVFGLYLALSLASCGKAVGDKNGEGTPTMPTSSATITPQATETPARDRVLIILFDGSDPMYAPRVLATLEVLTTQGDMELVESEAIPGEAELNSYRIVILFSPEQAALDQVQQQTEAIILVFESQPINPGDAWVIGSLRSAREQAAFLAGYIAAVLTPDWRIGVISAPAGDGEPDLQTAFVQGGQYFCGLCRPAYPPYFVYPVSIGIDSGSAQGIQIGLAEAQEKALDTILLDEMGAIRVSELTLDPAYRFLGLATPPDTLRSAWIATLRPAPELALEASWPKLLTGESGEFVPAPIVFEDVNPVLLTEGKMRLVETIRDDLVAGYIQPVSAGE